MNQDQIIAQAIHSMAHIVAQVVVRCEDARETLHLGKQANEKSVDCRVALI